MRVKAGIVTRRRHKKILKMVKGQRGPRSRLFRRAMEAWLKSMWYAYRDRRNRKRDLRRLWIMRINAAARQHGVPYSRFMHALRKANIQLNRKMLAELAVRDPKAFQAVLETAIAQSK